jgi:ABC-type nitrate/sulfonate/bicarbonate transport system substrate-binding protein
VSRSKLRGVGLTLVTLLFLSACGSDTADGPADPDPTPQPTETTPDGGPTDPADSDPTLPEMTVMRMANVAYFGPEYIAIDQGFDKKYNLTIEILQAASLGVPGIQAVAAGQADTFQSVAFDSWMKGLAAGVDLTGVISGQMSGGDFDVYRYYVRADSGIRGPEDLVGKTMGIAAVGSYGDVPMDLYLQAAGIDPSAVERLAVPPGEIPNALATGQIDIAAAFSNIYAVLDADYAEEAVLLFADKEVLPVDVFVTSYGFSTQFIQDHPDRVQAFIAAIKDAVAFIQANPEAAQAIIAEVTGAPPEALIIPAYPPGLCMDLSLLDEYRDMLIDLGYLDTGALPDVGQHFTNDLNPDC